MDGTQRPAAALAGKMKSAALLRGVSRINVWQSFGDVRDICRDSRVSKHNWNRFFVPTKLSSRQRVRSSWTSSVTAGDQWAAGAATHAEWSL